MRDALATNSNSARLWLALGDADEQLSAANPHLMTEARNAWERAAAIEPKNPAPLRRLFAFWSEAAALDDSHPEVFDTLGKTAAKLFLLEPQNTAAEAAVYSSLIRPWLAGAQADLAKVEDSIPRLERVVDDGRFDDPDATLCVARARRKQAELARAHKRAADAKGFADEAESVIARGLRRAPGSAAMRFAAARFAESDAESDTDAANTSRAQKWLREARQLVSPDDPLFAEINLAAARSTRDAGEAENILRGALQQRPDDPALRLALAQYIAANGSRRAEAITLLEGYVGGAATGPRALFAHEVELRLRAELINLRLDALHSLPPSDRSGVIEKVESEMAQLKTEMPATPALSRLTGKLRRSQGNVAGSIVALEQARDAYEKLPQPLAPTQEMEKLETLDLLGRSYLDANEPGRAIAVLAVLVNRLPQYDPARLLLARAMMQSGDAEAAEPQVAYLEHRRPNDPDVAKLRAALRARARSTTPASAPTTNR